MKKENNMEDLIKKLEDKLEYMKLLERVSENITELSDILKTEEITDEKLKQWNELNEVIEKYPNAKNHGDLLLSKRIEDGIIKNLHNAKEYQLINIRDNFGWKYYRDNENTWSNKPEKWLKNKINTLILNNRRKNKLKNILND